MCLCHPLQEDATDTVVLYENLADHTGLGQFTLRKFFLKSQLSLERGQQYVACVRAYSLAGAQSRETCSDGLSIGVVRVPVRDMEPASIILQADMKARTMRGRHCSSAFPHLPRPLPSHTHT